MSLQNIFRYYNSCYQEDNLGTRIENIFSKNIESKYFFEGEDQLITEFLPYSPIDNNYGEETLKKINISKQNKELVYCSLFIIGKTNKTFNRNICSPLLIYPAELIKIEGDFFVKIDSYHRKINFGIFSEIVDDEKQLSIFHEELYNILGTNPIDISIISELSALIERYSSTTDTNFILNFPGLSSQKELKNIKRRKIITEEGKFILLSASVLSIIKKSVNTRGIINELTKLSEINQYSLPIRTIFGSERIIELKGKKLNEVPTILNKDQENILINSEKYPFSIIIGPPGTGKSYTLASLAIEKMNKGKSILIAASSDKAIDIIADKIENQLKLKNIIISTNNKSYKKKLINHVNNTISKGKIEHQIKSSVLLRKITSINKKLEKIEKKFLTRVNEELKRGKYIANNINKHNFISNLLKEYIKLKNSYSSNHWEIIDTLHELLIERNTLITNYIHQKYNEQLTTCLRKDLQSVNMFINALKSDRANWQEKYFSQLNFKTIFNIFPIWLVKMSDISRFLPLKAEIFDYVIIDEATQSNIAQAIPILQRGKKAIITGDPKQLRHFSFLSNAKQNIYKEKFNLINAKPYLTDYKNASLLDLLLQSTMHTQQINSLYEHYRSKPAIINFSNTTFYNNELKIMNSRPDLPNNQGIELIKTIGTRNKKGYNKEEAQIIINSVKDIVEKEKNIDFELCSSIGILSPFRDQVDHISRLLSDNFSYEQIAKHNIIVNTAYGFQGDERDIIYLSFAIDNNSSSASIRYLNKEDVFNVSITRACERQIIVYSIDYLQLSSNNLLRRYLENHNKLQQKAHEKSFTDDFLNDVVKHLKQDNFEIWQNYNVAGLEIDIIAKKNNKIIGIDLIGFPGQFEDAFSVERYKMLNRAGLYTIPLPYTLWSINRQNCLQKINQESLKTHH